MLSSAPERVRAQNKGDEKKAEAPKAVPPPVPARPPVPAPAKAVPGGIGLVPGTKANEPRFTDDVYKYLGWLSASDVLAEGGPERPTAATTLRQRRELVRIAASNLLESGFPPDERTRVPIGQ